MGVVRRQQLPRSTDAAPAGSNRRLVQVQWVEGNRIAAAVATGIERSSLQKNGAKLCVICLAHSHAVGGFQLTQLCRVSPTETDWYPFAEQGDWMSDVIDRGA